MLKSSGKLVINVLHKGGWLERPKSKLFPKLDIEWLASLLGIDPQSKAVAALRSGLHTKRRKR